MKPKRLILEEKTVTLMDAPKEDIKKPDIPPPPPPPPPPPVKKIETLRFVPPVVTEKAETEPPVITPPDPNVNIGTKNIEGEKTSTYTPPIEVVAPVAPPIETPKEVKKVEEDIPFVIVEQNPEFVNGTKAMYQFLSNNIKYPAVARESAIEGTVYVGFVVGKDGSIRDVVVKRGIGGGCNEEAVRVVKLMPNWNPGKQQGKPVSVAYTIPIKFHLD
jgi:protein TonB